MTLISINVGLLRKVIHRGQTIMTGIFKAPVAGLVWHGRLNLVGDGHNEVR
jgi:MOSC domain-containing protein YiiM